MEKRIGINFNLEREIDKRVYYAIQNLPGYFGGMDVSEALIKFINDLVVSVMECESRKERCEELLSQVNASNLWN